MKAKWLLLLVLAIVFTGGRFVMAHGEDHQTPSTSHLNGGSGSSMDGMDMNGKDKNMDMSGRQKGDDMEGMDMGGDGHSHEPVVEKQANLKVLGTYGAVNFSFIVFGVWNKWFRRKDGSNGNSK